MKPTKSNKAGRKNRLAAGPATPARGDSPREGYSIREIFETQEHFGWDAMVERIRRGDRIRGRSL